MIVQHRSLKASVSCCCNSIKQHLPLKKEMLSLCSMGKKSKYQSQGCMQDFQRLCGIACKKLWVQIPDWATFFFTKTDYKSLYREQGTPCTDYRETPVQITVKPPVGITGNPCTDYREYLYRLKGNPFRDYREYLYGLQGNPCKYYRETPSRDYRETPVGYTGILLYRVCTGISCCMYMQVTGQNLNTGIPCSDYREKINSVFLL